MKRLAGILAFSLLGLWLTCCGTDECEDGQAYCDAQGVAYYCAPKPKAGIFGQPRVWTRRADCHAPELCMAAEGTAFCIIDPAKAPKCASPDGAQCTDKGELDCKAGHATRWMYCDDACAVDTGRCPQAPGEACADGGTCIGNLECRTVSYWNEPLCVSPCSCANGEPCAECDAYLLEAGYSSTCIDGWCAYGRY